jgi:hypothetical protein
MFLLSLRSQRKRGNRFKFLAYQNCLKFLERNADLLSIAVVLHPSSRVLPVATSLLQVAARSKPQQRQIDPGNGRVSPDQKRKDATI